MAQLVIDLDEELNYNELAIKHDLTVEALGKFAHRPLFRFTGPVINLSTLLQEVCPTEESYVRAVARIRV